VLALLSPTGVAAEEATSETLGLGQALYAENCASCHGAKLEGQPDWKRRLPSGRMPAPPHDVSGHTWHHADDVLFQITKDGVEAVVGGGYQSDMPAFGDKLSDDEIRAILAFIKSSWAERERGFQAEVTRASQEVSR
jgi:mono/diheme cytochrome c family protein